MEMAFDDSYGGSIKDAQYLMPLATCANLISCYPGAVNDHFEGDPLGFIARKICDPTRRYIYALVAASDLLYQGPSVLQWCIKGRVVPMKHCQAAVSAFERSAWPDAAIHNLSLAATNWITRDRLVECIRLSSAPVTIRDSAIKRLQDKVFDIGEIMQRHGYPSESELYMTRITSMTCSCCTPQFLYADMTRTIDNIDHPFVELIAPCPEANLRWVPVTECRDWRNPITWRSSNSLGKFHVGIIRSDVLEEPDNMNLIPLDEDFTPIGLSMTTALQDTELGLHVLVECSESPKAYWWSGTTFISATTGQSASFSAEIIERLEEEQWDYDQLQMMRTAELSLLGLREFTI